MYFHVFFMKVSRIPVYFSCIFHVFSGDGAVREEAGPVGELLRREGGRGRVRQTENTRKYMKNTQEYVKLS